MATRYEYFNAGDDAEYSVYGATWHAQTFTVGSVGTDINHTATSVKLLLKRIGTPVGTLTVAIRVVDGDGLPTGSNLCSGTLDETTLTTSDVWYEITQGTGTLLQATTKYALVVSSSADVGGNRVRWRNKAAGGYAGGNRAISSDSGSTWGASTEDFMFEVWGAVIASPTVATLAVTDILPTTATGNGNITDLGEANPTAHGVCWNTTGTPTTADDSTDEGAASATGTFTTSMTGLVLGTKYYVRAYATNIYGTGYGSDVTFIAITGGGSSELAGVIAVVETRFHYVDAYGQERYIEGKRIKKK